MKKSHAVRTDEPNAAIITGICCISSEPHFSYILVRVRVFVSNPPACSGEQFFRLYYWSIGFVFEVELSNDTMTDVRLPNSVNQPIYLT